MEQLTFDPRHPSRESLTAIDIHELLPQQEPFVMVGALADYDEKSVTTQTTISPGNIFVDEGLFSASGILENIAQTCAARIGYVNKYILKRGIQIGYIGSVKNFQLFSLPRAGETILTKVNIIEELFGVTLARASVSVGDRSIAATEIKIAIKEEGE